MVASLNEPRWATPGCPAPVPEGQLCNALGTAAANREVVWPLWGCAQRGGVILRLHSIFSSANSTARSSQALLHRCQEPAVVRSGLHEQ